MLVPNLGIYIPTQEELRLQRIRLATGQRSSGQHRGSFQIHPRVSIEVIFMHMHTAPHSPPGSSTNRHLTHISNCS